MIRATHPIPPIEIPSFNPHTPDTVFYEVRETREFGTMLILCNRKGWQPLEQDGQRMLEGLPREHLEWVHVTTPKIGQGTGFWRSRLPASVLERLMEQAGFSQDPASAAKKPAWVRPEGDRNPAGDIVFNLGAGTRQNPDGAEVPVVRVCMTRLYDGKLLDSPLDRAILDSEETAWLFEGAGSQGAIEAELIGRGHRKDDAIRIWYDLDELAVGLRYDRAGRRFLYIETLDPQAEHHQALRPYHLRVLPDLPLNFAMEGTWFVTADPESLDDTALLDALAKAGYRHDPDLDELAHKPGNRVKDAG